MEITLARMKHANLCSKDLGRSQLPERVRYARQPTLSAFPTLKFGKHKGCSVPSLFFRDLDYFRYLHSPDFRHKPDEHSQKIWKQLHKIWHLASNIRLPPESRSGEFVVIESRAGNLSRIVIASRNVDPKLRRGEDIVLRTQILNVWELADFPDQDLSERRLLRSLKTILFPERCDEPSYMDCQNFFACKTAFKAPAWAKLDRNGN